jgi:hypothetical protein
MASRHRRPGLVATVALGLVLCGCGVTPDPLIDTWPVGASAACPDTQRCEALVAAGLAGLDARDPGHAAVVATELRDEGVILDPSTGHQILMARSGGCCAVLLVRLADGTTRAIGVGYPGISREPVAIPWEVTPRG